MESGMNMEEEIRELKEHMYSLLTIDEDNDNIKMVQNMGVSLSNAIKKDGVVINQFQSLSIKKTVNIAVRCLRIVDKMIEQAITAQPVIEQPVITQQLTNQPRILLEAPKNVEEEFLNHYLREKCTLKEFKKKVTALYVKRAIESSPTKKEAADFLDVQRAYISKITNKHDDDGE
jgi:hypothetical protein